MEQKSGKSSFEIMQKYVLSSLYFGEIQEVLIQRACFFLVPETGTLDQELLYLYKIKGRTALFVLKLFFKQISTTFTE